MISKYTYKNLTWIDIESPSEEDIAEISSEFGINKLVQEELLNPTLKPKVDLYPNYIYLILHFPALKNTSTNGHKQEVDFIIGKEFIITTHYGTIDALHQFSRIFEVSSMLENRPIGDHAGYIFYYMAKGLYGFLLEEMDRIRSLLHYSQDKIFKGNEREMVKTLSNISRDLLDFQNATMLHKEVLGSLEIAGKKFFGEDFSYYLRDISGEYYKVENIVEGSKDYLTELRITNDSLLSTKQNELMRMFTVVTFIFLPLQLITAIFTLNTKYIPLMSDPEGFWIITIGIIAFGVILYGIFKLKRYI